LPNFAPIHFKPKYMGTVFAASNACSIGHCRSVILSASACNSIATPTPCEWSDAIVTVPAMVSTNKKGSR
jgi:hypothetical protein